MQTFLPYPNFARSAEALDNKRLGKQRVETLQIMTALLEGRGWVHHPAVKMWSGYEGLLMFYQEVVCFEWLRRGFRDSCYVKTADLFFSYHRSQSLAEPLWLGNPDFHLAHQSNLIRKDPEYYSPQFPEVPDNLPYIWPM